MQDKEFKKKILKLIAEDMLEKAIEICMEEFDVNSTQYEEIVIISSNFRKWRSDDRKGLNPGNESLNKVRVSIIELVNDYIIFNPGESNSVILKSNEITEIEETKKVFSEEKKLDYQAQIREKAKKEYPTDFEMQKYVIDQQMNAFRRLQMEELKDIPKSTFESIREKAKEEYPNDYEMQEYIEKQQMEAYRKIQSKKPEDIPQKIWEQIKNKAISEYPKDFEMQKYIEDKQVASYRNLNNIKPKDIPSDTFQIISKKATSEYQFDYEMQEYIINQQIKAYRELNKN